MRPCQFQSGVTAESLGCVGSEVFSIRGIEGDVRPRQDVTLVVTDAGGSRREIPLVLRADTRTEIDYLRAGGMMPFILADLIGKAA